jgi:hypothetical protein
MLPKWNSGTSWSDQPNGSPWASSVVVRRGPWRIRVVFVEQEGQAVPRELEIQPADKKQIAALGLTGRTIDSMTTFADLFAIAQKNARRHFAGDAQAQRVMKALRKGELRTRAGRGNLPNLQYARWAVRYEKLLDDGMSNPTAQLAAEEVCSRSGMATRVARCRALGFLEPSPRRGMAGGRATAAAHELVAAMPRRRRTVRPA